MGAREVECDLLLSSLVSGMLLASVRTCVALNMGACTITVMLEDFSESL